MTNSSDPSIAPFKDSLDLRSQFMAIDRAAAWTDALEEKHGVRWDEEFKKDVEPRRRITSRWRRPCPHCGLVISVEGFRESLNYDRYFAFCRPCYDASSGSKGYWNTTDYQELVEVFKR